MSSNQGIPFKQLTAILHKNVTCGSCLGFKSESLIQSVDQPCSKSGKEYNSTICRHYRADAPSISESARKSGVLNAIFSTLSSMTTLDIEILGASLLQAGKAMESGFCIGQPVYVRIRNSASRNYLSNFAAAWVVGATDKHVYLASADGSIRLTYENTGSAGPSIYDKEHFEPLLELMKSKGNLFDPMANPAPKMPSEAGFLKPKRPADGDWDPQTLDKVSRQKKPKKLKSAEFGLVEIVAALNGGQLLAADIDEETGHIDLGDNHMTKQVEADRPMKRRLRRKKPAPAPAPVPSRRPSVTKRPRGSGVGRVIESGTLVK